MPYSAGMKHALPVTAAMARQWFDTFVNRRAFTLQSARPHPDSGRHYYFRPKDQTAALNEETARRHLAGQITVGLYAINPATQRCKWVAIDADYRSALDDLLALQAELRKDGVEACLEKSNRGGHLWVLFATPCLARMARVYVNHIARRLAIPIKGAGLPEGLEVFPRQDSVRPAEFGNAIRGPLGVHRGADRRFWFYFADYSLEAQLDYLARVRRVTEAQLLQFVQGMEMPPELPARSGASSCPPRAGEFRILDHVEATRRIGRNWVTRCPSCAAAGHDHSGDNLAVSVDEPRKYICWAGCTREMIRLALGRPIRRSA